MAHFDPEQHIKAADAKHALSAAGWRNGKRLRLIDMSGGHSHGYRFAIFLGDENKFYDGEPLITSFDAWTDGRNIHGAGKVICQVFDKQDLAEVIAKHEATGARESRVTA